MFAKKGPVEAHQDQHRTQVCAIQVQVAGPSKFAVPWLGDDYRCATTPFTYFECECSNICSNMPEHAARWSNGAHTSLVSFLRVGEDQVEDQASKASKAGQGEAGQGSKETSYHSSKATRKGPAAVSCPHPCQCGDHPGHSSPSRALSSRFTFSCSPPSTTKLRTVSVPLCSIGNLGMGQCPYILSCCHFQCLSQRHIPPQISQP